MVVVRVFSSLAAIGGEEDGPRLFINPLDVVAVKLPGGDLVLQRAAAVEEIIMPPAVALRPMDKLLPVVDQPEWLGFDIGVQPLFDQRLHFARRSVGDADVNAMHVAAGAAEI